MVIVKTKKTRTGYRLQLINRNGNIFNHDYNQSNDAKRAWDALVKQIKAGKVKFER